MTLIVMQRELMTLIVIVGVSGPGGDVAAGQHEDSLLSEGFHHSGVPAGHGTGLPV